MEVLSIEEAQSVLPQLIERLTVENLKCKITSEEGSVVVIPEEMYDHLLVTLEFLSTPGLLDHFKDPKVLEETSQLS